MISKSWYSHFIFTDLEAPALNSSWNSELWCAKGYFQCQMHLPHRPPLCLCGVGGPLLPFVACLSGTLVCPALGLITDPGSILFVSSAAPGLQVSLIRGSLWWKQSQPRGDPPCRSLVLKMAIRMASESNRLGFYHLLIICCAT